MKILKEQFDRLTSDDITKKDYDTLVKDIHSRVNEIVMFMCNKNFDWYDFSNEGGTESSPGWFDPVWYKDFVEITGHIKFPPPYDNPLGFPTRWIWEDFEEEFKRDVDGYVDVVKERRAAEKAKREARKAEKAKMIEVIKSKLSKEELKFIKFK